MLIAHGHSPQAIGDYTFLQLRVYAEAAGRRDIVVRMSQVIDTTVAICGAFSSKGDIVKKHLKSMETAGGIDG